jgi:hypothetical protein
VSYRFESCTREDIDIRRSLIGKTLVFKTNNAGSIPAASETSLAQLVERQISNLKVAGSSPARGAFIYCGILVRCENPT